MEGNRKFFTSCLHYTIFYSFVNYNTVTILLHNGYNRRGVLSKPKALRPVIVFELFPTRFLMKAPQRQRLPPPCAFGATRSRPSHLALGALRGSREVACGNFFARRPKKQASARRRRPVRIISQRYLPACRARRFALLRFCPRFAALRRRFPAQALPSRPCRC